MENFWIYIGPKITNLGQMWHKARNNTRFVWVYLRRYGYLDDMTDYPCFYPGMIKVQAF